MNRKVVKRLHDHIAAQPDNTVNLNDYVPRDECGTQYCIAGFQSMISEKPHLWHFDKQGNWSRNTNTPQTPEEAFAEDLGIPLLLAKQVCARTQFWDRQKLVALARLNSLLRMKEA